MLPDLRKGKLFVTCVGLVSFSDGRPRVYNELESVVLGYENELAEFMASQHDVRVCRASKVVGDAESARDVARQFKAANVDGLLCNVPVFAFPNYLVSVVNLVGVPVLTYAPADGSLPGLGGMLAAAGSLKQLGLDPHRVWGELSDHRVQSQIARFMKAVRVLSRLRGSVYGLFGGRSMGMYTGVPNSELWQTLFGVDVEHVDQSEIIRVACSIDDRSALDGVKWLESNCAGIDYDGGKLSKDTLLLQLKSYLAICRLAQEQHLDFIGVKCHPDLSEHYVTQCIACAMCNDPYDWRGAKKPLVFSCEADSDGALTMYIMHVLTNQPVSLLDLRHFDRKTGLYTLCNCGALATWFAGRSETPAKNLSGVRLVPTIQKYRAGGAHLQFMLKPGPATFARLSREQDSYKMYILSGEFVEQPVARLSETCPSWPHAFVRLKVAPEELAAIYDSNHVHMTTGCHQDDLLSVCRVLGIRPVVVS